MNKLHLFIALIASTILLTPLKAQESDQKHLPDSKRNYVVLTRKVQQLKPILLAAEALQQQDPGSMGDFQVVLCGKEVDQLTQDQIINPFVKRAENLGVQLVACGFSLQKFKVDQASIPPYFRVVDNGILHNLQLQDKGYRSLEL